jgi:hypothetical protein
MHTHTWQTTGYLLIELPTSEGYADRLMSWRCACGYTCDINGHIKVGTPIATPRFWDELWRQEQRIGTAEAREARRQQR